MMLLFVSHGNLTLLFFSYKRLQLIKSDESLTFVHTVRINKLEANLAASPEKVWTFKRLLNTFH